MEVQLSPDQEALIRDAISGGRFAHPEDAVHEALLFWEQRERARAELLASLEVAEASIRAGEGIPITEEDMRQLALDVMQQGRQRMSGR